MTKKPGLPLERHQALGLELDAIQSYLAFLQRDVGNAYPQADPAQGKLQALADLLLETRHALENLMLRTDPDLPLAIYFPKRDRQDEREAVEAFTTVLSRYRTEVS